MWRSLIAIARVTVQAALRSRFFLTLAGILLISVFLLPLSIKGDGTLAGQLRIAIHYTLALASFVLGAATLWIACGSISQEIERQEIHLVMPAEWPPRNSWPTRNWVVTRWSPALRGLRSLASSCYTTACPTLPRTLQLSEVTDSR